MNFNSTTDIGIANNNQNAISSLLKRKIDQLINININLFPERIM